MRFQRMLGLGLPLLLACGDSTGSAGGGGGDAGAQDGSPSDAMLADTMMTADATDSSPTDGASADASSDGSSDAALGPYPSGPYGNAEGDTISPFVWEGYVDLAADAVATTKAYGAYAMDDARRSGKAYALVHTSETFDPGCQNSARDLAADGPTLVAAGAVIVEILVSTSGAAPTKTNLDAWVNQFALHVTSVIDPAAQPLASVNALGRRELAFIVDLATMKILKKYTGPLTGVGSSAVKLAEPDLHTYLGH